LALSNVFNCKHSIQVFLILFVDLLKDFNERVKSKILDFLGDFILILEYLPEKSEIDILGVVYLDLFLLRYHIFKSTLSTFIELVLLGSNVFEGVDSELFQESDKFLIKVTISESS